MKVLTNCNILWWNDIHVGLGKKNDAPKRLLIVGSMLEHRFCSFCPDLHQCYFITKICRKLKLLSMFITKEMQNFWIFYYFSDFTIHQGACELWIKEHFWRKYSERFASDMCLRILNEHNRSFAGFKARQDFEFWNTRGWTLVRRLHKVMHSPPTTNFISTKDCIKQ